MVGLDDGVLSGDSSNSFVSFLDTLFDGASKARLEKDVVSWFDLLCVIGNNLSTEMNEGEVVFDRRQRVDLLPLVNAQRLKNEDVGVNFIDLSLDEVLSDWEIFLRKIRKKAGLQQDLNVTRVRLR